MKIGILRIGQVDSYIVNRIHENLQMIFPNTKCALIDDMLPIAEIAFEIAREQYRSDVILAKVQSFAAKEKGVDRVLGIVDLDLFVPNLNFVFGEAECPGRAALISLWRLRPEFYGKRANTEVFLERSTKEAVHELGHTLGLTHCTNVFCVMFFSNSIFDSDRKRSFFCNKCYLEAEVVINNLR